MRRTFGVDVLACPRSIEQVIASIRAAGRAGLAVIEYNFYANRLMEGYK